MSAHGRGAADGVPPPLLARACAGIFAGEARPRSGLAYAAGFAGLAYLFRLSAGALAWEWFGMSAAGVALAWSAAGPLAMALGLAAARELVRAPWKAGKAQALVGYALGLWGTLWLVTESLFRR